MKEKEKKQGHYSARIPAAQWILIAALGSAGGVAAVFFGDEPSAVWVGVGIFALLIIAVVVMLIVFKRRFPANREAEGDGIADEPYEIQDPLFKRIMDRYNEDGLSDFVNYVSLRGWKLGYVDSDDDWIEFIFIRHERQVMVSLFDGYAEMVVELQSENGKKLKLDYSGFNEPVELWNAIINGVRAAARSNAEK